MDLKTAAGQTILKQLVGRADVVVENFRPSVWQHWDTSLATWRSEHDRLVTCTISGFGTTGPRAGEGGYDAVVQAMSGLMSITGPSDGSPTKVGVAAIDILTGAYAANGILGLLLSRDRNRHEPGARHCEVSLYEAALQLLANVGAGALLTGEEPRRWGNGHPMIVPYQTFSTKSGESVFVAVGNDGQWRRLARVLGRADWEARTDWATNRGRLQDRDRVVSEIESETRRWNSRDLVEALEEAEVPAGPVRGVLSALGDPVVEALGVVLSHTDGTRTVASPIRGPARPEFSPPPHLGEHSEAILRELGRSPQEIGDLFADAVVRQPGSDPGSRSAVSPTDTPD